MPSGTIVSMFYLTYLAASADSDITVDMLLFVRPLNSYR